MLLAWLPWVKVPLHGRSAGPSYDAEAAKWLVFSSRYKAAESYGLAAVCRLFDFTLAPDPVQCVRKVLLASIGGSPVQEYA